MTSPDLHALIAEVRRLDKEAPPEKRVPAYVFERLRTAAPLLAAECERLREALTRALEAPVDGAAAIAGLMGENRKLRERVARLEEALRPFARDDRRDTGALLAARAALKGSP